MSTYWRLVHLNAATESKYDDNVDLCEALSSFVDNDNKIDLSFFKYIVAQKDLMICELNDKIKLLNQQVELLHKCLESNSNNPRNDKDLSDSADNTLNQSKLIDSEQHYTRLSEGHSPNIDLVNKQPSNGKTIDSLSLDTANVSDKQVVMGQSRIPRNVQVGPISSKPVGPSTYAAIASRKPTVIIGKKSSGLKAVNKLSWIFVSRFLPEISKTNVEEYLKDSNLAQFECIELPTKYDTSLLE